MKQKVSIARTMIHDPEVVVFDEPTAGLNVITAEHIIDLIRRCKEDGKTVIFSLHIMSEVDLLCDDLAIIHEGKILFDGNMDHFRSQMVNGSLTQEFIRIVNNAQTYRLLTIFGYFLNPHFSVGLGVGLDGYHDPTYNTMPLFVEGRGYLWNSRNTPYIFLDLGKAIKAGEEFEEGFFLNTGIGYKFFLTKRWCMNISFGFNSQHMREADVWYFYHNNEEIVSWERKPTPINMKAFSINVAFHFNIFSF